LWPRGNPTVGLGARARASGIGRKAEIEGESASTAKTA
jgi:hypothetical protein